jgi:predicted nuclease of predicted toxin-antitoxin system
LKIKIDENLPVDLAAVLLELGHEPDTVHDEGMEGRPDDEVWAAAQREGRFFITQDLRWSDSREYVLGSHYGILLLRLADPDRRTVFAKVQEIFKAEGDLSRCYVVATENKVRLKRPDQP